VRDSRNRSSGVEWLYQKVCSRGTEILDLHRESVCTGLLALICSVSFPFCASADPPIAQKLDYNFDIRPILADRCFVCHGPDKRNRKADLRLDLAESAFETAIVPGKPAESELIRRITATDHTHMPPPKSNLSLTKSEIERLRRWIAEGAEYKKHWAFLPLPAQVAVPAASNPAWPHGSLDHFILARLDKEGLAPSSPASKEDWIRRVTFDLTGLPPTPAEVDAFRADSSPRAYENVVDRLLAAPAFGERMALEWLDVARYADSFGYQADGDTFLWPWRDWVIEAFNQNLPYDQFLTCQLAGDLLEKPTRKQRLATAFNRLHRMTNEGGSIPEEWRNEYVSDRVHTFGTAFLGLTLECARCHDHKYDPIATKEYYGLGAFFNSIDEWGTYDNSHFRPTPTLSLPTPQQEKALADLRKKVAVLEEQIRQVERTRRMAFQEWLAQPHQPEFYGLISHFPLDRLEPGNRLTNVIARQNAGTTSSANVLVPGKLGQALRFTGDDAATFNGTYGVSDRWQPFTLSFWLQVPEEMKEGIVFHATAGTDTGFHGLECSFDQGRLFLGLIRFWPGNAAAIRTRQKVPPKQWVHVSASYDGSGKAQGLRIHLNGVRADADIVRDCLTRNLEIGRVALTFGERARSTGLKGGLLDDFFIFDRALTDVEIAHLHDGKSLKTALDRKDAAALQPYFLGAVDGEVRQARADLQQARERLFNAENGVFEVMVMEELPRPRQAYVLARGNYDAPKDKPVGRITPAALPAFPKDGPRDRLTLARWLTDPSHPLTAHVAVNRYWQLFFGRGLVSTTENFGIQGAVPSHPDLLDWLARDFIASGWDVKALCKKIVLSATYRQRSTLTPELRKRDAENVLLARGPSRRLSAEMLRDAALAESGLLVRKLGGPPVKPSQPPGLWRGQNAFLPEYVPDKGEGLHRRSLYTFWRRTSPPPNMLTFDVPSREVCVVRRQSTCTPLQPLVLLNDPQFVEAARGLGERMLGQKRSLDERLIFAFRVAATRSPTQQELELLRKHYQRQLDLYRGNPVAARKYLGVPDRSVPDGIDVGELAAAAVTANVILNLDAAIMLR
jgi:hypothetical protein